MKRILAVIAIVVLAALGYLGFHWYQNLHENSQVSRLRLLNAEYSYLTALSTILTAESDPEKYSDVSVFVSANAINSVLAGFQGTTIAVPQLPTGTLTLRGLQADFRDGFPGIDAQIDITNTKPSLSTEGEVYCVLQPSFDPSDPSKITFHVVPLYAKIGGTVPLKSTEDIRNANSILGDLLSLRTDLAPTFEVPLSKAFAVSFPASHIPLPVPTPAGRVIGELDVPGLNINSSLRISGVLFLSDGVHIFASTHPTDKTDTSFPYAIDQRVHTSLTTKAQDTEIENKEKQISELRQRLASVASPLRIDKSDIRVWISQKLIGSVNDVFNGLTPQGRTVNFHSESVEGQLMRSGGGALGCGWYAELVGPNALKGTLKLSDLASTWQASGLAESVTASFAFNAQITGHINGPAGPHVFMVTNCFKVFGATQCLPPVPSTTISCDTPIGGGVGVPGGVGLSGDRTERLTANLNLHSDATHWLQYDLALSSPDSVPITISVGLGQLGTVGIPITFNVPRQTLLSGSAPSLFSQEGALEIPGTSFKKRYTLDLIPTSGTVGTDGYAAFGKLTIAWH